MANEQSWEEVLRAMLGVEGAEKALEAMREAGLDPEQLANAAELPVDPGQFSAMLGQLKHVLASSEGPVNWQLAHDVARQHVHSTGADPTPVASQSAQMNLAFQQADLWLDAVTDVACPTNRRGSMSRANWVETTLPTFQLLAEPVAENVVRAVVDMMKAHTERLEIAGLGIGEDGAIGLLQKMGSAAFGFQLGAAVASLAGEAFGLSDIGLPLVESPSVGLVGANVDAFADSLEIPVNDVTGFLAVREAATARLYGAHPWLRGHVLHLVASYAREISIDADALEETIRDLDPTNLEDLKDSLGHGFFSPELNDIQRQALANLETTLAVIEGWVEHVTQQATRGFIDSERALTEMMRRRRGTGGPAEDTFKNLVGLELRPRRCREASELWGLLEREVGPAERDKVWSHPDLMPTAAELDDPGSFITGRSGQGSAFDLELQKWLGEGTNDSPSAG